MASKDNRVVFFFDIDNCENRRFVMKTTECSNYATDSKILEIMSDLIDKYFVTHLSLSPTEAQDLHSKYYKDYGLAIDGLVRHHKVDALEFNSKVDDAVSLDTILKPDPALRQFLEDIDTSKCKPWLFTNAYINHGKRVVRLLGVENLFEGITYCDYGEERLLAKPHKEMFAKAMREAGVEEGQVNRCYFVDDSYINVKGASGIGWNAVHFVEPSLPSPEVPAGKHQISDLEELRGLFPELFRSTQR